MLTLEVLERGTFDKTLGFACFLVAELTKNLQANQAAIVRRQLS